MVLLRVHVKFTTVPTGLTTVSEGVSFNTVIDDGYLVEFNKLKLLAEIKYKFCRHVFISTGNFVIFRSAIESSINTVMIDSRQDVRVT